MTNSNRVETFEDHVAAITEDFPVFNNVLIDSDDSRIAVIDYECGRDRWVSLICEDCTGGVTQMNIAGQKAIDALAAVLNTK